MNSLPESSCFPSFDQPIADQRGLGKALLLAIDDNVVEEVFRLAPQIDHLDRHRTRDSGDTPLILAARRDLPPAAVKLLLGRSDATLRAADGSTALILAAWGIKHYSAELVSLLLPHSDPLALRDENGLGTGSSALNCAIFCKNRASIAMLLPRSDLAQIDRMGMTPLEQAIDCNSIEVVDMIRAEMARREALALAAEISTAAGLAQVKALPRRL